MRRLFTISIASLALAAPAMAQASLKAPAQPTLGAPTERKGVREPIAPSDLVDVRSQARKNSFDPRTMERRNHAAIRSICADCAPQTKRAPRRVEPDPEAGEMPIEDPAVAPVD